MKDVLVIGIGTGSPEHITMAGVNALNRADLLFLPDKGADKADLADLRRAIVARYSSRPDPEIVGYAVPVRDTAAPDYAAGVAQWHAALAERFTALIARIPEGGSGAFLVWGDPGLYDSTLRILERVGERTPITVEIIPGITAIQALTAAHGIALTGIGAPVLITTGRRLGPVQTDTVVMLDGRLAFGDADPDLSIYWGAYLGTPEQMLISGRLGDVAEEIIASRAAARARQGWIMDIYLLRPNPCASRHEPSTLTPQP